MISFYSNRQAIFNFQFSIQCLSFFDDLLKIKSEAATAVSLHVIIV